VGGGGDTTSNVLPDIRARVKTKTKSTMRGARPGRRVGTLGFSLATISAAGERGHRHARRALGSKFAEARCSRYPPKTIRPQGVRLEPALIETVPVPCVWAPPSSVRLSLLSSEGRRSRGGGRPKRNRARSCRLGSLSGQGRDESSPAASSILLCEGGDEFSPASNLRP
jgi:hypothetical protein